MRSERKTVRDDRLIGWAAKMYLPFTEMERFVRWAGIWERPGVLLRDV